MSITATEFTLEPLVFALVSVDGATAACRAHGDRETAQVLASYYALIAAAAAVADGRVVKVIGDGVLVVFPGSRPREAVAALRSLQAPATGLWSGFDPGCRVCIKVGAGPVAAGMMGAPGAEQFDVYGAALNDLFKAPGGEFVVMPELAAALR